MIYAVTLLCPALYDTKTNEVISPIKQDLQKWCEENVCEYTEQVASYVQHNGMGRFTFYFLTKHAADLVQQKVDKYHAWLDKVSDA